MFVTSGEQLLNAGFEGAYTNLQSEWTVIVNIPDTLRLFRKRWRITSASVITSSVGTNTLWPRTHTVTHTHSLSLSLTHTVSDAHTAGRYT